MNPPPVCPKCGQTPAKVSERAASSGGSFFSPQKASDSSLICTYRCECGTTFTRTEQPEDKKSEDKKSEDKQFEDKQHDQRS